MPKPLVLTHLELGKTEENGSILRRFHQIISARDAISCAFSTVEFEQAAEPFSTSDRATVGHIRFGVRSR